MLKLVLQHKSSLYFISWQGFQSLYWDPHYLSTLWVEEIRLLLD